LHQSLLQLLFLYLIRIERPIATSLRIAERWAIDSGDAIVAANLAA
jgi:hypothetical protein